MNIPDFFFNTFSFDLGKYSLTVPYVQAIAIIFLIFLLIITMAQIRHHYLDWSFKGAVFGIFFGFVLAFIVEGFFLIYGKTALIALFGWENAPKPISSLLDVGKNKFSNVLGVQDSDPGDIDNDPLKFFQKLDPVQSKRVKSVICN